MTEVKETSPPIVWCERKLCASALYVPGEKLCLCTETAIRLSHYDGDMVCDSYDPTMACGDCKWFEDARSENPHDFMCQFTYNDSPPCDKFESKYDGKEVIPFK